MKPISLGFCTFIAVANSYAGTAPELCAAFGDDVARLSCYDAYYSPADSQVKIDITAENQNEILSQSAIAATAVETATEPSESNAQLPLISRNQQELELAEKRFSMTPHRPNYILPVTYNASSDYSVYDPLGESFSDAEIKFQLSIKTLLARDLWRGSSIWLGYTQQSYWQLYADTIASEPFRETNHEPELIWQIPTEFDVFGWNARLATIGLNHQSNGRIDPLSRSWNRVTAGLALDKGNFVASVKTWVRIEEPEGAEDNPNIEDYMGRVQLGLAYQHRDHLFFLGLKNNLSSDNRSGVELNWSFPLVYHLKGFVQVYSGYGENLIDMENDTKRIGIGIALNDWL
ncbi:phospholipase [Halieaceae bacterium IMCC14734]|uniref:Phospholipase A1 n=1 Tax=Candidatus Litorirhabdus singularis TaxID=2518993 RepID=A0ABT3TID1_9GAMM|nr:phospholipase A [Candidatus Litorirhabdus singularis]MCX2982041.1 phospholipase [Candidatus Litorirhabdus singularis]